MKKIFKTLICAALSLVLTLSLFACKSKTGGGSDNETGGEQAKNYIRVVEDGKSDYTIVIPEKADECIVFSADELQSFIQKITGVKIPIKTDAGVHYNASSKIISLGKTTVLSGRGINTAQMYPKLNLTGFYIDGKGSTVIIDAQEEVGILYGVYELLERYGGVRFVTEDYTYVPESKDFFVEETQTIEVPAFQLRTYLNQVFYSDKLFQARKRFGNEWGVANNPMYGGGNDKYITESTYTHDHLILCEPSKYMAGYPRIFNIINGVAREICMTYGITDDGHIDQSVPVSAATIIRDKLKEMIKESPERIYFFVGQEDHSDYCNCSTCVSRTQEYGNQRSSIQTIFLNAILEELLPWVEENYPGREVNLVTFAYRYSQEPAVDYDEETDTYTPVSPLIIPNDHLYIRIAPIEANGVYSVADERQNPIYKTVFGGWQALTDHFWIWDYSTQYADFNFIVPCIAAMQENYRYYEQIGVTYCMTQSNHRNSADFQERLKIYVASKLMWDPDENADALVKEYFELYFGKYADTVSEFWETWNRHLSIIAADPSVNFFMAYNNTRNVLAYSHYPLGLLENSVAILEKAIEENDADTSITEAQRVKMRKRLLEALVIPERMILRNIASYYGTSAEGEYAKKYYAHVDEIGQEYQAEFVTVADAKRSYGL